MKNIIIGDVKILEHNWITNYLNGDVIWFFIDQAVIGTPYGCTIRNIISTLINQEVEEIYVIGLNSNFHSLTSEQIEDYYQKEQIGSDERKTLDYMCLQSQRSSLTDWIKGLPTKEENIRESVKLLKQHPIIPKRLKVTGFLAIEDEKVMKQIV